MRPNLNTLAKQLDKIAQAAPAATDRRRKEIDLAVDGLAEKYPDKTRKQLHADMVRVFNDWDVMTIKFQGDKKKAMRALLERDAQSLAIEHNMQPDQVLADMLAVAPDLARCFKE